MKKAILAIVAIMLIATGCLAAAGITEKKTDVISGFLSKKGLFFDARLKLNDEFRTEFEFDNYS